ncbi:MAG: 13E12 repeat family protein, partial [Bifidobacteriaceae bacterium]|nr:13E12 repeat family protein [Bifidobacteriaceae bacterium]
MPRTTGPETPDDGRRNDGGSDRSEAGAGTRDAAGAAIGGGLGGAEGGVGDGKDAHASPGGSGEEAQASPLCGSAGVGADGWGAPGVVFVPSPTEGGSEETLCGTPVGDVEEWLAGSRSSGELVALANLALSRAAELGQDPRTANLPADEDTLAQIVALAEVENRAHGLMARLAAKANRDGAGPHTKGLCVTTWLAHKTNLTRRQAAGVVLSGRDIHHWPVLEEAVAGGGVNWFQAQAITRALGSLPDNLEPGQRARAEETMVSYTDRLDSDGLRRIGRRLAELVAPDKADEDDARRAQREYDQASKNRFL